MSKSNTTITSTKKSVRAEIERRNEIFKNATPAEKRVLIAKDVLALIKAKKITPASGTWVEFYTKSEYLAVEDKSFREAVFDGEIETCDCCALGSIMTSCTLFKNKITIGDAMDREALSFDAISHDFVADKLGLQKLFGKKQLALIEIAFEQGAGFYSVDYTLTRIKLGDITKKEAVQELREETEISDITLDEVEKAYKFGSKYNDEDKRLVAIMKNIVKNKGTFNP